METTTEVPVPATPAPVTIPRPETVQREIDTRTKELKELRWQLRVSKRVYGVE